MGFHLTLWSLIVPNLIFEVSLPKEQEKRLTLNEHDDDDDVSLPRIEFIVADMSEVHTTFNKR
jgi:hypothetical protein